MSQTEGTCKHCDAAIIHSARQNAWASFMGSGITVSLFFKCKSNNNGPHEPK